MCVGLQFIPQSSVGKVHVKVLHFASLKADFFGIEKMSNDCK